MPWKRDLGIGLADFTTARVVNGLDKETTYMDADVDWYPGDEDADAHRLGSGEAVTEALATLAPGEDQALRVVRIATSVWTGRRFRRVRALSGGCIAGAARAMEFDAEGNLARV